LGYKQVFLWMIYELTFLFPSSTFFFIGELRRRELVALAGGIDGLTSAKGNLTKLLDIMTRMGLICAIVPFGEGGKNLANAGSASYLLRRQIQYEEPIQIHTTTAPATHSIDTTTSSPAVASAPPPPLPVAAAAGPSFTVETQLHTFDATTRAGRTAYWLSLQYMVMCSPMAGSLRSRIGQKSFLTECFPFSKASEAIHDRAWVLPKTVLAEKLDEVGERISTMVLPQSGYLRGSPTAATTATGDETRTEGAAAGTTDTTIMPTAKVPGPNEVLNWEGALALSKELQVPFETVARAVNKAQSNRLRGVVVSTRRLGALGGRSSGGRGSSAAMRKKFLNGYSKRRKRRRGGVSDEDDTDIEHQDGFDTLEEAEAEEEEYARPMRQRKKKWFSEEDRELLYAWATWLAAHGPDKILRWKFVKGRPRGLLPISCKYRIQVLKANEKIGPMMMKILELAGGVHSRHILKEAAAAQQQQQQQQQERNTRSEPGSDAAVQVGEKRKFNDDGDGDYAANEVKHASKRARGEEGSRAAEGANTAARALTADLPPLWSVSDTEDATALQLVVEEIESVVSTAPSRYIKGMKKPDQVSKTSGADGELFDQLGAGGGGDRRGRNVLGGLGGRLLGPAARGPVIIARQFTALRQWARAAAAARENGTARPPLPSVAMAMELVKSLLLAVKEEYADQGGSSLTSNGGSGSSSSTLDGSFSTALTDRFSPSDIKEAIAELIRLGHITLKSGISTATTAASGGLALSNRFMLELQPLFLHGGLFTEAYAAHAELVTGPATPPDPAKDTKPSVKTLLPSTQPPPSSSATTADGGISRLQEMSGGVVAAVLSTCVPATGACSQGRKNEKSDLAASLPRSVRMMSTAAQQQQHQPSAGAPGSNEADAENEENILRVLTSIKVTATIRGGTTTTGAKYPATPTAIAGRPSSSSSKAAEALSSEICIGAPRGQVLAYIDLNGLKHILQFSSQEEVLYQPSLVAADAKLRTAAEAACKKLFTFKKIGGTAAGGGTCMDQMLKSLRAAGATGLPPSEFLISASSDTKPALPEGSSKPGTTTKCLETTKEVQEALGALCRCGLARRVSGYDDIRIVASDISPPYPRLLAFPPPESITPLNTALASLHLPKQGTVQPCIDVPLRPWVDHIGRLKPSVWRALLHRAVSTVLQYPGVAGDVLLQSLRVVNPQHAREIVSVLCGAGIFYAKTENNNNEKKKKNKAVTRSVLAACFGDEQEEENEEIVEEDDDENMMMGARNDGTSYTPFPISSTCTASTQQNVDSSWNFFIDPGNWWQAMEVLPPAVLIPAHAEKIK